jgi:hypothetical protein
VISDKGFATSFKQLRKKPDNLSDSQKRFSELNGLIRRLAAPVPLTVKKLIPPLAAMEQLLSQKRGWGSGMRGLPRWSKYLNEIADEYDLSVRTIQRHLHKYRGENNEVHPTRGKTNKQRGIPPQLTPTDRRQLVQLAGAVWEFLGANEKGTSTRENARLIRENVRVMQRHAIAPTKLQAIMDGQPDPMQDAWYTFMVASLAYQLYLENTISQTANETVRESTWKRREQYRETVPIELQYLLEAARSALGKKIGQQSITNSLLAAAKKRTAA